MNEELLSKAKQNKKLRDAEVRQKEMFDGFISDLTKLLSQPLHIGESESLTDFVARVEQYGSETVDLISSIKGLTVSLSDVSKLELPDTIEFRQIVDDDLKKTLADHGELLAKLSNLDQAIDIMAAAVATKEPGDSVENPSYVRIVLGPENAARILENWPTPVFGGGGGGSTTDITPIVEQLEDLRGFQIPDYDEIDLGYTGDNLTTVEYSKANVTVATLTLSYTGDNLTNVVQS